MEEHVERVVRRRAHRARRARRRRASRRGARGAAARRGARQPAAPARRALGQAARVSSRRLFRRLQDAGRAHAAVRPRARADGPREPRVRRRDVRRRVRAGGLSRRRAAAPEAGAQRRLGLRARAAGQRGAGDLGSRDRATCSSRRRAGALELKLLDEGLRGRYQAPRGGGSCPLA